MLAQHNRRTRRQTHKDHELFRKIDPFESDVKAFIDRELQVFSLIGRGFWGVPAGN
jgi:hypothetical protein